MLCQYRDDGCQESPFIGLSQFVGNHLSVAVDLFIIFMVPVCVLVCFYERAAGQAAQRPAIVICC